MDQKGLIIIFWALLWIRKVRSVKTTFCHESLVSFQDPSSELVGSKEGAESQEFKSVFEDNKKRPKDKRKRKRNDDPSDIEG